MTDIRSKILAFYDALDQPATKDVSSLLTAALADTWESWSSENGPTKSRDEFIAQVKGFGRAFTELRWSVDLLIVTDDHVVARSTVRGTPAGEFRGVPHTGRSFEIMAIDVHTVNDGRLVRAHHVEDWFGAVAQLKG